MFDLTHFPALTLILILGYPAVAIVVLEFARRIAARAPFVSTILRQTAYVLLPTGAIWLILRFLAEQPADNRGVRMAETAFALTGLYILLHVVQVVLMSVVQDQMRAPKLLFDIVRIGLSVICGSVMISNIWNVNLGSIFAAIRATSSAAGDVSRRLQPRAGSSG